MARNSQHSSAGASRSDHTATRSAGKSYFDQLREASSKDRKVQESIDRAEKSWKAQNERESSG